MSLIAGLEDDPGVAKALGEVIQESGWEWRLLPGGPETLGAIREFKPDIVTTGNRHPTIPGLSLLEAMQRDLELRMIPIVFVTPRPKDDLWAAIRNEGLDPDVVVAGYVQKPFEPATLVAELMRVLRAHGHRNGVARTP